jgi:hypothetical protein
MLDRRLIRLVVPHSPTLFFEDKGAIYGTTAESAGRLEDWINKTFKLGTRLLTVPLTPVSPGEAQAIARRDPGRRHEALS